MVKRMFFIMLAALVIVGLCSGVARAAIPPYISFQGRLTKGTPPTPETSATDVTFGIYPSETSVSPSWQGTITVNPDSDGIFNVILGLDNTTGGDLSALSFDGPLWVEVKVGTATSGTRQRLTSVPYAFRSKWTDNVPDPIVPDDTIQDITGSLVVAGGIGSGPIISLSTGNAILGTTSSVSPGAFAVGGLCSSLTGNADAVVGTNFGKGIGVKGISKGGYGVYGDGYNVGVVGTSGTGYGVFGETGATAGIYESGVFGKNTKSKNWGYLGGYTEGIKAHGEGGYWGIVGESSTGYGGVFKTASNTLAGVNATNTGIGPALELGSGWIKVPAGSGTVSSTTKSVIINKIAGKVTSPYAAAADWYTVFNSYVTDKSIIIVTPQDFEITNANLTNGKLNVTTGVKDIKNGSFKIYLPLTIEGGKTVAFLVINQ